MNSYRVALILCRAVAVALWWFTGIRVLSLGIVGVIALTNVGGLKSVPAVSFSLPALWTIVPLIIAAGFVQSFAPSLANSMVGGAAFEGESIDSRRGLDASEKGLARAGAGLFLLSLGAPNAAPSLVTIGYAAATGGFGSGTATPFIIFNLLTNFVPATIQCFVGFVLAFLLGLRRLVKSAE